MSNTEWIDITSYSRNDKERAPSWWQLRFGKCVLRVGNKHIHHQENPKWFMIFNNGQHEILGAKDQLTEEEAKAKAIECALGRLELALDKLREFHC